MRRDLPRGLATAQVIHAAGESGRLSDALPSGTHAVALVADDEAALVELGHALCTEGIPFVAVVEDDTPYTGQLMAIGVAPRPRDAILKKILGRCRLVK